MYVIHFTTKMYLVFCLFCWDVTCDEVSMYPNPKHFPQLIVLLVGIGVRVRSTEVLRAHSGGIISVATVSYNTR
jgi:hypothetical protein